MTIEDACRDLGLSVRIGCHSDRLWRRRSSPRFPVVSQTWPLTETSTRLASPFGGLIYIEVPVGCQMPSIPVTIEGAVEAPFFVLGKASPAEWREKIRDCPAPWGELATDKVILSLPSPRLRKLDDPTEVLEFWNRVLDACAELAGWPLERYRPERFVLDVAISAGYMHSGYPLMTHLDVAPMIVNKESASPTITAIPTPLGTLRVAGTQPHPLYLGPQGWRL